MGCLGSFSEDRTCQLANRGVEAYSVQDLLLNKTHKRRKTDGEGGLHRRRQTTPPAKAVAISGGYPLRNVALLTTVYNTGMMVTEIAKLPVRTYLNGDGSIRVRSSVLFD
jgi:hypothetical protein